MGKIHDFFWESPTPEYTLKDSYLIRKHGLLAYRIFGLAAMLFIYIYTARYDDIIFLPLQYMTNWGITCVGLYFAGICYCYILYRDESNLNLANPFAFWKFVLVLGEFAFSIEILIPPYFWLLLYPNDTEDNHGIDFWLTVCAHGITPLLIWIETIFNKNRFYKRHLIIMILLGLAYIIVNGTYTVVTGDPVYSNLTWKNISTLYYLIASLIVAAFGFGLGYALSCIKFQNKKVHSGVDPKNLFI